MAHPWRYLFSEETVALMLVLFVFTMPAQATTRLTARSLFMQSSARSVVTDWTISFNFMSPEAIGSIDFLFCVNPIPYTPCVTPAGLDTSGATLTNQTGETGFTMSTRTSNHIILSRSAAVMPDLGTRSSYTFSGIKNPSDSSRPFSVRLLTFSSTDGSEPSVDFGSVRGQVSDAIVLQTQVPPMLIFCAAHVVYDNCSGTDNNYYTDMGQLSPTETLVAQSQMAVGTNATGGFAITASATPLAAGTSVINSLAMPTESKPGTNQFGINLVANTEPNVGQDPDGIWANALAAPGYDTPDRYKFVSGDVIAYSSSVSLMKKFTVSYIINSSSDLHPGVYTTTVNYIASGRF